MTGIVDKWPHLALTKLKRLSVVIACCSVGFLLGLSMVTQVLAMTMSPTTTHKTLSQEPNRSDVMG
jgi:hypothetical protein